MCLVGAIGLLLYSVFAESVSVPAEDLLCLGVPDNELLVAIGSEVQLIDIGCFASAASACPKGLFSQSAYLEHGIGGFVGVENIEFVFSSICFA